MGGAVKGAACKYLVRKLYNIILNKIKGSEFIAVFAKVFSIQIIGSVVALPVSMILARSLGVESYGYYVLVMSITSLAAGLSCAGMDPLLVREVARYYSMGKISNIIGMYLWARRFSFAIAAALVAIISMIALILYYADSEWNYGAFLVAVPLVFIISQRSILKGVLRGCNNVVASQIPDNVISPLVLIIAILTLFYFDQLSVYTAILAQVLSAVASIYVISILMRKSIDISPNDVVYSCEKKRWLLSLPSFSLMVVLGYANTAMYIPLVGVLTNINEVAYFKLAFTLSIIVSMPLTIVETVMHNKVSELYAAGKVRELIRMTSLGGVFAFMLSAPIILLYILGGNAIITLMYGVDYSDAYYALVVLAVGHGLTNAIGPSMLLLHATQYEKDALYIAIIGVVITIGLSWWLIPSYGAVGCAVAFSGGKIIRASMFRYRANLRLIGS